MWLFLFLNKLDMFVTLCILEFEKMQLAFKYE